MENDLEVRVRRLERQNRILTALLLVLGMGATLALLGRSAIAQGQSIRVSEVVVVDGNGVERVRIAGALPDPVVNGRTVPRGQQMAGILLYDADGMERSGYGTFSPEANVGLTLDGKQGQRALFVATPEGDSALKMWRGNDWVEFRVDEAGARLNAVRARALTARIPTASQAESASLCSEYQALRAQVAAVPLMAACRERMSESDCGVCLK
jgi:hypothetical protein